MSFLLSIALLFGLASSDPDSSEDSRTRWVFSTVQHSEWCPAGNVWLDLRTGTYELTQRAPREACDDEQLERPKRRGQLKPSDFELVRSAFALAENEGLESPVCLEGGKPDYMVVSNGGPRTLVLTTGARTESAPSSLGCWSEPAMAIHDLLNHVFDPYREEDQ